MVGNNLYIPLCTHLENRIEGTGRDENINNDTFLLIFKVESAGFMSYRFLLCQFIFIACLLFILM